MSYICTNVTFSILPENPKLHFHFTLHTFTSYKCLVYLTHVSVNKIDAFCMGRVFLIRIYAFFFYLSENFYKIWKDLFQHFLAMTLAVMCFTVFTEKLEETPSELLFLFTYLLSDIGLIFYKRKLECQSLLESVIRKIDTILLLLYLALYFGSTSLGKVTEENCISLCFMQIFW